MIKTTNCDLTKNRDVNCIGGGEIYPNKMSCIVRKSINSVQSRQIKTSNFRNQAF